MALTEFLALAPVVPVLTVPSAEAAVPLARALVAGGLPALEITLRTEAALEAVRRIAAEVPDAVPGVGTVTAPEEFAAARAAGARFAVSPGFDAVLAAASDGLPWLPGIATASEAMTARRAGFRLLKFFPAEAMGGTATLKAFAGPFADLTFCPTGGIGQANAGDYLALGNVVCVGGSWPAPAAAVEAGDWDQITTLARDASALAARLSQ